jgi:hypothetical protein
MNRTIKPVNLFQAVIMHDSMKQREQNGTERAELEKAISANTEKMLSAINTDEITARIQNAMRAYFEKTEG